MEQVLNIIFFIVFLGMLVISARLMLDSNYEKLFKQGKVGSIRAFFFISIFLISVFTAFCFTELVNVIYNLLK
jgi:hypothetical protein